MISWHALGGIRLARTMAVMAVFTVPSPVAAQGTPPVPAATSCSAPNALVALDHVIVAVHDLDPAAAAYRAAGFTLKPGRLHDNGLLNAHAKLRDLTEIELMSVPGEPTDVIARGYRDFLHGGEGGAFVAFRGRRDAVLDAVGSAGLQAEPLAPMYVVFPRLPRIFTLESERRASDPDSLLTHANGAVRLEEVWLEGDERLERFLVAVGATRCGVSAAPADVRTAGEGNAFAVMNGRVVVVPPADSGRPLLRGVILGRDEAATIPTIHAGRAHGIWIAFRAGR